jgi:hypothetical protein
MGVLRAIMSGKRPPKIPLLSAKGTSYAAMWSIAERSWDADANLRPPISQTVQELKDLHTSTSPTAHSPLINFVSSTTQNGVVDPAVQLERLIEYLDSGDPAHQSQPLDDIYNQMIRDAIPMNVEEEVLPRFQAVFGALVTLTDCLVCNLDFINR